MKDSVFQQLLKPLTSTLLKECNRRFRSDYNCEKFHTWPHLQTMIYARLNEIKSLNTLEIDINSQSISIDCKVKRSTLSDANQRRSAECFIWILQNLLGLLPQKMRSNVNKLIKILDSSPIQLKGRGYDEWAKECATRR